VVPVDPETVQHIKKLNILIHPDWNTDPSNRYMYELFSLPEKVRSSTELKKYRLCITIPRIIEYQQYLHTSLPHSQYDCHPHWILVIAIVLHV